MRGKAEPGATMAAFLLVENKPGRAMKIVAKLASFCSRAAEDLGSPKVQPLTCEP